METRRAKIISGKAGGTASSGSATYKISLPSSWVKQLDNNEVTLSFDGNRITITPRQTMEGFLSSHLSEGHKITVIRYYNFDHLCSLIYADNTTHEIIVENYTDSWINTALGKNDSPSWDDLEEFLEERCIPRTRAGLKYYLKSIGLVEYDPWDIVRKTQGKMAEDNQWLEIEELR